MNSLNRDRERKHKCIFEHGFDADGDYDYGTKRFCHECGLAEPTTPSKPNGWEEKEYKYINGLYKCEIVHDYGDSYSYIPLEGAPSHQLGKTFHASKMVYIFSDHRTPVETVKKAVVTQGKLYTSSKEGGGWKKKYDDLCPNEGTDYDTKRRSNPFPAKGSPSYIAHKSFISQAILSAEEATVKKIDKIMGVSQALDEFNRMPPIPAWGGTVSGTQERGEMVATKRFFEQLHFVLDNVTKAPLSLPDQEQLSNNKTDDQTNS